MIQGIQILGIFFALIMLYLTFYNFKRKTLSKQSYALWTVVWVLTVLIALFPQTLYGVMEDLSIQRTVDFIALIGFAFFAVLIFYLHSKVNKMQEKLERLVRNMAMKEAKVSSSLPKKKVTKKKTTRKK